MRASAVAVAQERSWKVETRWDERGQDLQRLLARCCTVGQLHKFTWQYVPLPDDKLLRGLPRLTGYGRLLLGLVLAAVKQGWLGIFDSAEHIAAKLGISERTVYRQAKRLVELGLLDVRHTWRPCEPYLSGGELKDQEQGPNVLTLGPVARERILIGRTSWQTSRSSALSSRKPELEGGGERPAVSSPVDNADAGEGEVSPAATRPAACRRPQSADHGAESSHPDAPPTEDARRGADRKGDGGAVASGGAPQGAGNGAQLGQERRFGGQEGADRPATEGPAQGPPAQPGGGCSCGGAGCTLCEDDLAALLSEICRLIGDARGVPLSRAIARARRWLVLRLCE
jgi:DNA-binding transcriptional ArsR family regulator